MRGTFIILFGAVAALAAEPNLPPTGRSMFDYLVHQNGGRIPRSVVDLVATMERLGGGKVATVMQPDSRSSQRMLADDAHPRILGVGGETRLSKRARSLSEAAMRPQIDRIFFAFSERARTLEVLSYNPKAARNEFQFVRDFGTPNARLFYVRRHLCLQCHIDGHPIFSRDPWSDSDQVDVVADRLRRAIGSRTYQGLPIGRPGGVTLTRQVERGATLAPFVDAWRHGFDAASATAGRELLLATALGLDPLDVHTAGLSLSADVFRPLSLLPDRPALPRPDGVAPPPLDSNVKARPFLLHSRFPLVPQGAPFRTFEWGTLSHGGRELFSGELRRTVAPWITHALPLELIRSGGFEPFVQAPRAPNPYELHRVLADRFRAGEVARILTDLDPELPPAVLATDGEKDEAPCPNALAVSRSSDQSRYPQ